MIIITIFRSRYQAHRCPIPTIMPSEATLSSSFLELIQILNEKLASECTGVRGIHGMASVAALTTQVRASPSIHLNLRSDLTVDHSDRISGKQCTQNLGAYSRAEEPLATSKLVAARGHFSYRPIYPPRAYKGHEVYYSDDSRMSVLAQLHYLNAPKLDSYIQSTD